jgi:hypothetical protein
MFVFPKLEGAAVAPAEVLVAPAMLDAVQGKAAVDRVARESVLRPSDIGGASLDPPSLCYAPFWRVVVDVRPVPILPRGGMNQKDVVVMVGARRLVPYEPRVPSPLDVSSSELVADAHATGSLEAGEIVEADVIRAEAARIATGTVSAKIDARAAIHAMPTPEVRGAAFVLYPLYFARYRRSPEQRPYAAGDPFVMVSARNGAVAAAKHPSAVWSIAAKVRRLLSSDRR